MPMNQRVRAWSKEIDAFGLFNWFDLKRRYRRSHALARSELQPFKSRHAAVPLYFRPGSSDFSVLYQIFIEREYRCLDEVQRAGLVIDCGANVGYSSAYFLSRYPDCYVVAVEPDPGNFAMLQHNLAPFRDRVTLLNTGIWSSRTGLVISSESFGDNREWAVTVREAKGGEKPTMQAVDIGTLLRESGKERISILKIDIEGSESEVFSKSVEPWLGLTDTLVIELHGDDCTRIFHQAISDEFEISRCDELTVCKRVAAI